MCGLKGVFLRASPSPPWSGFVRTAPAREPGSECGRSSSLVWRGKLVMYLKPDAGIFQGWVEGVKTNGRGEKGKGGGGRDG